MYDAKIKENLELATAEGLRKKNYLRELIFKVFFLNIGLDGFYE